MDSKWTVEGWRVRTLRGGLAKLGSVGVCLGITILARMKAGESYTRKGSVMIDWWVRSLVEEPVHKEFSRVYCIRVASVASPSRSVSCIPGVFTRIRNSNMSSCYAKLNWAFRGSVPRAYL